jgi:hypothetical protein
MGEFALPAARALPPWLRAAAGFLEREASLVAIACVYAFVLLRLLPSELAQDSWLTLVGGREVVEHGLPRHDELTVMTHGREWIDQQWAAKLGFYWLAEAGGLRLALLAHVALLTGAFVLAVAAARRLGASRQSVLYVAAGSLVVGSVGWQFRAQTAAYVLFVGVLWLVVADGRRPSPRLLLAFPLLVVWANVHGSVVVGALLVALRGSAIGAELVRRRHLDLPRAARALALVALPWACLLVTPYGASITDYYQRLLLDTPLSAFVEEWSATALPQNPIFYLFAGATLWVVARSGTALSRFERLVLLAMLVGGFVAVRNVVWFALAAVVLVPRAIDATRTVRRPGATPRGLVAVAGAAIVAVAASVALVVAQPATSLERRFPAAAADAVRDELARDADTRVFASERYADWLLWKVPETRGRVAFDVRMELLSVKELRRLYAFNTRLGSDWRSITRGYDVLVLDRRRDERAAAILAREPGTRTLYRDPRVVVLRRAAATSG